MTFAARLASVVADPAAARRWLWRSLFVLLIGGSAGAIWDSMWHMTVPFDGFWSPPHVMIYLTVAVVSLMGMGLLFTDRLRMAFEPGFRVRFLPFEVPGGLFILGSALGLLGFAGAVLDNAWHSAFGLNETRWSFPHAMIGTSLLMLALGYLSARQNMPDKPVPASTRVLLGFLAVWLSLGVFTGPLTNNRTPESVQFFFSTIPVLAQQESAQHVFRIYDGFNLNRTHPALLLLGAVWLGAALTFLRAWDARAWVTLLAMGLLWLFDSGNRDFLEQAAGLLTPANYQALPLPVGLYLLLARWREGVAVALAGILFALLIWGTWEAQGWAWTAALLSPLGALLGRRIGQRGYEIIAHPVSLTAVRPLILFVVGLPMLTGLVDLWLRSRIA